MAEIKRVAPTRRAMNYKMPMTIQEVEQAARRAGMSYGAYVAQLNAVSVIRAPEPNKKRKGRPS